MLSDTSKLLGSVHSEKMPRRQWAFLRFRNQAYEEEKGLNEEQLWAACMGCINAGEAKKTPETPKKRLQNRSLTKDEIRQRREGSRAEIRFLSALTGEVKGVVHRDLPLRGDIALLSDLLMLPLWEYRMVVKERAMSWSNFTLTRDMSADGVVTVQLMKEKPRLVNTWQRFNLGTRRYYDEFKSFVSAASLLAPKMEGVVCVGARTFFHKADVRELAAVVLQMKASRFRELYSDFQQCNGRGRSYSGCLHAVAKRAGVSHAQATEFVHQWCFYNSGIVCELDDMISENEHQTYFG
jgi:hypothetical protein